MVMSEKRNISKEKHRFIPLIYIIYLIVMIILIYSSLKSEYGEIWSLLGLLIGTSVLLSIIYFYRHHKK